MLDARRLRVFLEIADRGSISGAAAALAYTPSALSQQLALLERELGVRLFERLPRGVRLTEPGRVLYEHARAVADRLATARADLDALRAGSAGSLRLGWFTTAGAALMPVALALFRERHPAVRLESTEADPEECLARLRSGELDLALVYEFDLVPTPLGDDVELVDLLDDPIYVAVAPDHRLASRQRVRMAELEGETWIQGVLRGSTTGVLPRTCAMAGFEPTVVFRTDDHMAVQGLVATGAGVALVPRLSIPAFRSDIAICELDQPRLVRTIRAAVLRGRYRTPAVETMLTLLPEARDRFLTEVRGRLPARTATRYPRAASSR